jgi:hypothetical protein
MIPKLQGKQRYDLKRIMQCNQTCALGSGTKS